jgi:hypothetical protein
MQARDDAARVLRNSGDKAADFYEDHPLVVGAFAFAIGAAVAGALPRTRTEDEYLGSRSDELFDEAERIFETEKARASKVADAALKEAKTVISDTRPISTPRQKVTRTPPKLSATRPRTPRNGSRMPPRMRLIIKIWAAAFPSPDPNT